MAMDIMRNKPQALLRLKPAFVLCCLAFSVTVSANIKVKPSLDVESHAYRIRQEAGDVDRGISLSITPTLNVAYTSSIMNSSLLLQNQSLVYRDAQRDGDSFFTYSSGNSLSLLNDNLGIDFNFSQNYRSPNFGRSRFQDPINSPDNQTKTTSQSFGVSYDNDTLDWFQLSSNLSAVRNSVDETSSLASDPNYLDSLANDSYRAGFSFQSRDRSRKFFWAGDVNSTRTNREILEDFQSERGSLIVGFPFFANIAMVARGEYERNSNNEQALTLYADYQNYRTIGGGLEWQISRDSYWNITFNKVNNSNEDSQAKEYVGTEFRFVPSTRTSIKGAIDQRFFGRTTDIEFSYALKHFRMELKLGDAVGSLLSLSSEDNQVGLFVCPPGVTPGLDNCFQPPTSVYQPQPGEQYYNITLPSNDFSELLVVRQQASLLIGYDFNRLKLSATVGQRKDDFLEGRQQRSDKYVTASANWQLNQRNSLTFTANSTRQDSSEESIPSSAFGLGDSDSASLEWSRAMNRSLQGNVTFRRIVADDELGAIEFAESRLSVGLNYSF